MATLSEKVKFTGAQGDELAARLVSPDGEPVVYALWGHCFSCTKDIFAAARVDRLGATDIPIPEFVERELATR